MRKVFALVFLCHLLCFYSFSQTALSFNGTSSYVSTTANVVPVAGDFTIEFWTYLPSIASGVREFVSQGSSTGGQSFYIGTDFATGNIRCGDPWQLSGVVMPVAQWVHIAMTKQALLPGYT